MHTACILIHELQLPFESLELKESLYTFESPKLLHFIKSIPNHYSSVVCVGHNPAFTHVVSELSKTFLEHLPTAAWAQIQFEQNEWKNIQSGEAILGFPKEILK